MTPVAQPMPRRSLGRRLTNKLDSFVTAAHSHDYVQTLKEIEEQLDALTEANKKLREALEEVVRACRCSGTGKVISWDMDGGPPLERCAACANARAALKVMP